MRLTAKCRLAALVAITLLLPASDAHALGGLPDPSCGPGGFAILDDPPLINEDLRDVTVLDQGQILAVGRRGTANGFLVARFHPNGLPDGSFGSGGIQVQPYTGLPGSPRSLSALALQADGRIVVAGLGLGVVGDAFAFGRYLPDGTPDASFGDGGIKIVDVPGGGEADDVDLANSGAIYGVGGVGNEVGIVRLTPAGQPDAGFGPGGVRTLDIPGSTNEFAHAVEVLADGALLIAGRQQDGGFVAKLDAAGNPVANFGVNGVASYLFGAPPGGNALVLDLAALNQESSIFVAGMSDAPTSADSQLFAARLTASGALDPGYAAGGLFLSNPTPFQDSALALAIVQDRRILLAGHRGADDLLTSGDTWLLRLTASGALDPTFGNGGQTIASAGSAFDGAAGLTTDEDRRPVVAGLSQATGFQLMAGRFTADPYCEEVLPTIVGTTGADKITGTAGRDVVVSLAGNDKVNTGRGRDLVCAGRGRDRANGGVGRDKLLVEAGNDLARGGRGRDLIKGGRGRDKLGGGSGRDKLIGGPRNDRLRGGKGRDDICLGGPGKRDRAAGCEGEAGVP